MSTPASDLVPTHHMASEPEPGTRNHKPAVAASDTHNDGARRRQDIQAVDVHPSPSPGALRQPASSTQSTAFGGGQGYASPTQIRDQVDSSRLGLEPRHPDIATGPNLGGCTTSQGQHGTPTPTVSLQLQSAHTGPDHGAHGHTTLQRMGAPDARGTQFGRHGPPHADNPRQAGNGIGAADRTHTSEGNKTPHPTGNRPFVPPAPLRGPAYVCTPYFPGGPTQAAPQHVHGINKCQFELPPTTTPDAAWGYPAGTRAPAPLSTKWTATA